MYELAPEECKRRLDILQGILIDAQQREPDFICECGEAAKARQGALLDRLHAGDASALDELLEYCRGCMDAWAKDLCPTAAARACFKAELAATLLAEESKLTEKGFCKQIHVTATRVAMYQHQHVLQWHARQADADTGAQTAASSGHHIYRRF